MKLAILSWQCEHQSKFVFLIERAVSNMAKTTRVSAHARRLWILPLSRNLMDNTLTADGYWDWTRAAILNTGASPWGWRLRSKSRQPHDAHLGALVFQGIITSKAPSPPNFEKREWVDMDDELFIGLRGKDFSGIYCGRLLFVLITDWTMSSLKVIILNKNIAWDCR